MATQTVKGKSGKIEFDGQRYIHSRNCELDDPDAFVPNVEGDWIHPDAASADEVMRVTKNCASGAIQCERHDGSAPQAPPFVNAMRVRGNGPLAFNAPLLIAGKADGLRATPCRCGTSKRKPWCDGRHAQISFTATGEPAIAQSQPLRVRDGALSIQRSHNGPLKLTRNIEIVSGTGCTMNRVSETVLRRCGHSNNKAYCDDNHGKVGFVAE